MNQLPSLSFLGVIVSLASLSLADGPKDNSAATVRPVPPPGIEVPAEEKEALTKGLSELRVMIDEAKKAQGKNPKLGELLPDVEIYHKAVDWALRLNQFNNKKEFDVAREEIAEGKLRAEALKRGESPWTQAKGLVVRAYKSKIDGSVQPYGMVIPENYNGAPTRLDFWIHGRGETLSELSFVDQRRKSVGQIAPANTLVLHLYGRYCCANKFAGEVDLFEALEHAKKFYRIDEDRIVVRGFSMGGASSWQFGTHFADQWCAINPGAGFAETAEFLNVFQNEDVSQIPAWQKKLWGWYDATDYALNLANCPTIAYSGEIDKQKQAADIMERFLKAEGLDMLHIIGPQTGHKIHPDSLVEIEKRLAEITALGRNRTPNDVHFATKTLRYNKMNWVTVDAMGEHWKKARVDAAVKGDDALDVKTENVTGLSLNFSSGHCPLSVFKDVKVTVDGVAVSCGKPKLDKSFTAHLSKASGKWALAGQASAGATLAKRHGLSGPIDDAFMDAFLFVTPSGPALNEATGKWVASELLHARTEWQKQFRGEAPTRKDADVKEEDISNSNLVLWGDPSSNVVLKKIADKLPVKWSSAGIEIGGRQYAAGEHVPVLIFPNPLNPAKYVVINSSFTYREYDYLNNARQIPKLPDWAIVNLGEAPNAMLPGKIVDAGFFDENWQFKVVSKQ